MSFQERLKTYEQQSEANKIYDFGDLYEAAEAITEGLESELQQAWAVHVGEEYRLSAIDLDRLVNEAPAGSELGWAVKDLLLAHYELESLQSAREALQAVMPLLEGAESLDPWHEKVKKALSSQGGA